MLGIHLLALDRQSFESLIYERPEVSLAIMRVLSMRIKQRRRFNRMLVE